MRAKRGYEKPELKGVEMLEANTGGCCRNNTTACRSKTGLRASKGNQNKTS